MSPGSKRHSQVLAGPVIVSIAVEPANRPYVIGLVWKELWDRPVSPG
jgi:hypothetical protein